MVLHSHFNRAYFKAFLGFNLFPHPTTTIQYMLNFSQLEKGEARD